MKRNFLCAVFILLCFASFASGLELFQHGPRHPPPYPPYGSNSYYSSRDRATYISFNVSLPFLWEDLDLDDYGFRDFDASSRTMGFAVGADISSFFTKRLGIYASVDFYFPKTTTISIEYQGVSASEKLYWDDFTDSAWGVSLSAGPAFALARTERVLFALSPVVHASCFFADGADAYLTSIMVGLGVNAEIDFNITRFFFIRAAVDFNFDFIGYMRTEYRYPRFPHYDYEEIENNVISLVPTIGVGFRF